jgi:hypothetical protein
MYSIDMSELRIPLHAIKGRGVSHREPHRFERDTRLAFADGWSVLAAPAAEEAVAPATQVTLEDARSVITRNDSPDIGFTLGLSPCRRGEYGCIFVEGR